MGAAGCSTAVSACRRRPAVAAASPTSAAASGEVEDGDPDAVRAHVRAGVDPKARDRRLLGDYINALSGSGWTPLMRAASSDNVEVARVLLDAGADIAPANDEGYTAQMRAGRRVNELLMQRLGA